MSEEELRVLDTKAKLFDALLRLWAHQDAYVWNRARLIVGLQAGVLAGAYVAAERTLWLAALVLAAGGLLTTVLLSMFRSDERARDSYYQYLDPLAQALFGPPLYERTLAFQVIPEPSVQDGTRFRAGALLRWAFVSLIGVDFVYAASILYRMLCKG